MSMACRVCNHPKRLEIDRLLVSNKSIMSLARKYNLKNDALTRHRQNHLSRQLIASQKQRDIFHGDSMLKLIQDLLTSSQNILTKCENKPSRFPTALKAIAESRRTVEFLWEISVKLQEVKAEEERTKLDESSAMAIYKKGIDLLPLDELKKLNALQEKLSNFHDRVMALGSGKRPGRRTDLERKKRLKANHDRHLAKKKAEAEKEKIIEPVRRKMKRRKITPKPEKPVNEFDSMRDRLGMSNQPEIEQKIPSWSAP